MRSRRASFLLSLGLLGGCSSTHPVSPAVAELARLVPCNPLHSTELAASLEQPLAVARTRSGIVYAVSQVGSETVVWRSLDEQLVAYRVLQRNSALGATLFGVDDGVDGFALSLRPEPTLVRLFHSLAEALPRDASGTTSAGTSLEVVPSEALQGFRAATEISPLRLVGDYLASRGGGRLNEDVLLLRTTADADAPIAVFNNRDGVLRQQTVTESVTGSDGSLDLQFELYGAPASVHVEGSTRLDIGERSNERAPRGLTPLFLSQLEFRCDPAMPDEWAVREPRAPLPAASCSVPGPALSTCLDLGSRTSPDAGVTVELVAARVTEVGRGLPPTGSCSAWIPEGQGAAGELLWAHLEHAGGEAWLVLSTPEASLPFQVGEQLSLRALRAPFSWGTPTHEELELRSSNGDLLLWRGLAGRLSELRGIPEFEFTLGPERCRHDAASCALDVAQSALDSWRIDGDAMLIGSGEQVRQGPFSVQNAGIHRVFGLACADVADGWLELAVWRSPGD